MILSYIASGAAGVIFIVILAIYLISRNKYDEMLTPLDKKRYPFLFLVPAGLYMTHILRYSYTAKDMKLREYFQELHGEKFAPYYLKIHVANKFANSILILLIACIITVGISVPNILNSKSEQEQPRVVLEENKLLRPEFDENAFGSTNEMAYVEAVIGEGEVGRTITYEVNVPAQLPDDQECVERAIKNMEENYIDKWATVFSDGVSDNLNISQYAILGCRLEMITDTTGHFSERGQILERPLESDGKFSVNAKFVFTKGNVTEGTKFFEIAVKPIPNEVAAIAEIDKYVEDLNKRNSGFILSDHISLPDELSNVPIKWQFPDIKVKDDGYIVFLGGLLLFVIMFYAQDSDVDKRVNEKREKIRSEFPDFISKLVLLLSCGMTAYDAIKKIVDDHKHSIEDMDLRDNPLYYELETTLIEIDCGKPEIYAYEDFGLRCKISETMKFSSVLTQNLRRGSADLTILLKAQSKEIWEMRKAYVRIQGEKAGSKLIFPMMLSLVAVIVVVLYPAMGAI